MFPIILSRRTILSRRFAPAASVQSSYLTLSGCQLLSQGGPRVRQARHLCSHDCQRAPRKLSVHAVVLCASCSLLHCQALRARGKRALSRLTSRFRVASYCRRVDLVCDKHGSTASAAAANTATTTIHSPTHRWLRQALRIQRCTARPLFTRPAWPRRALR